MKDPSARCQLLPWDTEFFGFRIAQVLKPLRAESEAMEVSQWCKQEEIDCLYYLAPSDDPNVLAIANEHAFSLVDIRMTLELVKPETYALNEHIREVKEEDISTLSSIAKSAHVDSRFFFDSRFPRERCGRLFELWIEKSAQGYAQRVLVGEVGGVAAGYITCHLDGKQGKIGLLGVAAWARGAGLGRGLLGSALNFFKEAKVDRVTVVTQGRNIAAQRLYQKNGFSSKSVELWFHRWF